MLGPSLTRQCHVERSETSLIFFACRAVREGFEILLPRLRDQNDINNVACLMVALSFGLDLFEQLGVGPFKIDGKLHIGL